MKPSIGWVPIPTYADNVSHSYQRACDIRRFVRGSCDIRRVESMSTQRGARTTQRWQAARQKCSMIESCHCLHPPGALLLRGCLRFRNGYLDVLNSLPFIDLGRPIPSQTGELVPRMRNSIETLRSLQIFCHSARSMPDGVGVGSGCVCHSPR